MTAATLSRLPLSAGGALAGSLARGGLWTMAILIDAGYWAAGRFMRAPVAISCVVAIAGFSMLAGSNALFLQSGRHPAPLFFAPSRAQVASIKPAVTTTRPRAAASAIDNETTGSVGIHPELGVIGHDEVMALQKKLGALKLFDGTADGLFGRRTASAIKAFEIKFGDKPRGKLTHEVLAAVLGAPIPAANMAPVAPLSPAPSMAATAAKPVPIVPLTAASAAAPLAKPAQVVPMVAATGVAKPVPLAPIRRTVQTIAIAATPDPEDTFAANSLPASADASPQVATATLPADTPLANTQATVAPAVAMAPKPTAQSVAEQASALVQPAKPQANEMAATASPVAPTEAQPATQLASAAPAAADDAQAMQPQADSSTMPMNVVGSGAAAKAPAVSAGAAQTPAQRLAAQMGTLPPEATAATATPVADTDTSSDPGDGAGSTDPVLISKIQRGLASLGFLGAKIDGVPGEGTAKAIRNFEVFYDYRVTGLATPQLLNLLIQHGAVI